MCTDRRSHVGGRRRLGDSPWSVGAPRKKDYRNLLLDRGSRVLTTTCPGPSGVRTLHSPVTREGPNDPQIESRTTFPLPNTLTSRPRRFVPQEWTVRSDGTSGRASW